MVATAIHWYTPYLRVCKEAKGNGEAKMHSALVVPEKSPKFSDFHETAYRGSHPTSKGCNLTTLISFFRSDKTDERGKCLPRGPGSKWLQYFSSAFVSFLSNLIKNKGRNSNDR